MPADASAFAYGIAILLNFMFLICCGGAAVLLVLFFVQRWYKPMREDFSEYDN